MTFADDTPDIIVDVAMTASASLNCVVPVIIEPELVESTAVSVIGVTAETTVPAVTIHCVGGAFPSFGGNISSDMMTPTSL